MNLNFSLISKSVSFLKETAPTSTSAVTALRQRRDLGKPLVENRRITYFLCGIDSIQILKSLPIRGAI
jgi:hypothetical protein